MISFAWVLWLCIFGLGSLVWGLWLGILGWDLWLEIIGLESLAGDLWCGIFGSESWDIVRWDVDLGMLGNWAPEAKGTAGG